MTTLQKLKAFQAALEKWKEHGGKSGQGGKWDLKTRMHLFAAEPTPELFGINGGYEFQLAQQINAKVLK